MVYLEILSTFFTLYILYDQTEEDGRVCVFYRVKLLLKMFWLFCLFTYQQYVTHLLSKNCSLLNHFTNKDANVSKNDIVNSVTKLI